MATFVEREPKTYSRPKDTWKRRPTFHAFIQMNQLPIATEAERWEDKKQVELGLTDQSTSRITADGCSRSVGSMEMPAAICWVKSSKRKFIFLKKKKHVVPEKEADLAN